MKPKALLILSSLCLLFGTSRCSADTLTGYVTVDTGTVIGVIPPNAFGLNAAVWDPFLLGTNVAPRISQLGVGILRYPGGSGADLYHFADNSATTGFPDYAVAANTFDAFMSMKQQAGVANTMITVNYGSNKAATGPADPAEAANWVNYANVVKGYGVKNWEIGNEVYGNGEYGSTWEEDLHTDHSPTAYGTNAVTFINGMKAKDPSIKVGVTLVAPGTWPDGVAPDWNTNVLAQCGSKIDAVVVHWYPQEPGSETDSNLLSASYQIAGIVSSLRTLIDTYCGSNAPNVEIWLTETNSVSYNPGKQTVSLINALYLADGFMTWLENGVSNVDWRDLHDDTGLGNNNSSSLYGSATYGSYGILANGSSSEPALDTPVPPYYGLQMLSKLAKPGDTMVSSTSSRVLLNVHAVKQANGNLAVLLENKNSLNDYNVNVALTGYTPVSSATVYAYGRTSSAITSATQTGIGQSFTVVAPSYSLTTVVLSPLLPVPSIPAGVTATSGNAQVSLAWTASAGATSYHVKRGTVSGSGYATVGSPAAANDTDTGLTNGTSYYYVVSSLNASGESGNSAQVSAVPVAAVNSLMDFNGDGKADLVLQNPAIHKAAIWYMNGATVTGGGYISANLPAGWSVVGAGDFNADGHADLVLVNPAAAKLAIWFLNGTTVVSGQYVSVSLPAGWSVAAVGDMNHDGKSDIIVENDSTHQVAAWLMNGAIVSRGKYVGSPLPAGWRVVGAGDFDGDTRADLVLQNWTNNKAAIWYLGDNGAVTGGAYPSGQPPANWFIAGAGDYSYDGKPDIVMQNTATAQVAIWNMNNAAVTSGHFVSMAPPAGWSLAGNLPH